MTIMWFVKARKIQFRDRIQAEDDYTKSGLVPNKRDPELNKPITDSLQFREIFEK